MDARQFLNQLFGDKPDDAHVCIWTFPSKRSYFFSDVDAAADKSVLLTGKEDVYVGCGLYRKDLGPRNRGSKEDVVGLPGFWMDIDVAGDAHKKTDLPPTVEDAVDLVTGNGFDPTIIVHSGNGVHAWWLFKEPLIFGDGATSDSLELANERLQHTIRTKAQQKGWSLDATHDITRILRIPGTLNKKGGLNKPVTCIKSDGPRYGGPEDLDPFMVTDIPTKSAKITKEEKKQVAENITVDLNAQPPPQVEILMNEPKFRATWMGTRKDFDKQSPSEYVMSVASFGARWGMSDQEITDMIVSWYRSHIENPKFKLRQNPISMEKLLRPDYIPGTIARARHQCDRNDAKEFIRQAAEATDPAVREALHITADLAREQVSKAIGMNIVKIVKYIRGEKDPYYDMHTSTHVIQFKKPDDLFRLDRFKLRVAGVANMLPDITTKDWKAIARLFHEFMLEEHVDANQTTVTGRVKTWAEGFLENKPARKLEEVTFGNEPFVHNGHWHIFVRNFQRFIYQSCHATGDASDVELDLRRSGAEKVSYNYPHPTRPNMRRKINVWKLPTAIAFPPPMVVEDNCEPGKEKASGSKDSRSNRRSSRAVNE